jgi:hypothetical protein
MARARLYEFVFRGMLTEQALDTAGRQAPIVAEEMDPALAQRLGLDVLDEGFVQTARKMVVVYVAIAAFENSIRKFVSKLLLEELGANWWAQGVSEKVRKKAESRREEERKIKWHSQRGGDLINYTELGDLANIMRANWSRFEPYVHSAEWATSVFDVLERSRNVIMHSGDLATEDVERVGMNIRDWIKQVGA